jgi:hypothetical protein
MSAECSPDLFGFAPLARSGRARDYVDAPDDTDDAPRALLLETASHGELIGQGVMIGAMSRSIATISCTTADCRSAGWQARGGPEHAPSVEPPVHHPRVNVGRVKVATVVWPRAAG